MITVTGNVDGRKLKARLSNEYYVRVLAMLEEQGVPYTLQKIENKKRHGDSVNHA